VGISRKEGQERPGKGEDEGGTKYNYQESKGKTKGTATLLGVKGQAREWVFEEERRDTSSQAT